MPRHKIALEGGPTALARFGRYKSETESVKRETTLRESQEMKRFMALWERWKIIDKWIGGSVVRREKTYDMAREVSKGTRFSAKELEMISVACEGLSGEYPLSLKTGFLLSALINEGDEKTYRFHTRHLSYGIDGLGAWNTKEIEILGDCDSYCGYCMKAGGIHILGDAKGDWSAGRGMSGGRIIIDGIGEDITGQEGGEIIIRGLGTSYSDNQEGGGAHHRG